MTNSGKRADVRRLLSSGKCPRTLGFELLCALSALLVAGVAVLLRRRWEVRKTPVGLAKAAHRHWLSHPEDPRAVRASYYSVARLVEWFDALPVERRAEVCREPGLMIENDRFDEIGLYRFSIARRVPAYRLVRSHTRLGIGVPVVAWRPNDNSEKWDTLRPPEGIFAPATALLERRSDDHWTLRFLSPHTRESVSVGGAFLSGGG